MPGDERGRRRRVIITAIVLAVIAVAFYVGAFLVQRYIHSPAH